jgi:hypothetical protein
MYASRSKDDDWEIIDASFLIKLHVSNPAIDHNDLYASICQLTGLSPEKLREAEYMYVTDLTMDLSYPPEVRIIVSVMRDLGYFVYFAKPSLLPSINLASFAETLKFDVPNPDTKVIMMGLNTDSDKYMFFTVEPCSSPERGSFFKNMFGLARSALTVMTPTSSSLLTPTASQLDKAFNLNVY